MYSFDKTFFDGSRHTIRINCRLSTLFVPSAFKIVNVSPISYGDFDVDEYSFFPSNLKVRLTAYPANYYNTFKAEFERYSQGYPFNFKEIFYIEYFIDDILKHTGIINAVDYDDEREEIELTLTDASEKFKEVYIANPYYLSMLAENGLPEMTQGAGIYTLKFYGMNNAFISPPDYEGKYKVYPGEVTDLDNWKLTKFVDLIFKAVNPEAEITYTNDLLFADNLDFEGAATIEDLYLYGLHTNYLGRYIVVPKLIYPNLLFQFDVFPVYEDQNSIVFRYGSEINDGNIITIIKNLSQNYFSRPGFHSYSKISFTKKYSYNEEDCIEISNDDLVNPAFIKTTFLPKAKYVYVFDNQRIASSSRGDFKRPSDADNKIEFSINFSANELGNFSLFYFNEGPLKRAVYCKDPVTGYSGYISEVLAENEWDFRKIWRDKYSLTLWGTDWEYEKVYKMRDPSAYRFLRPMKIDVDTEKNQTTGEFIDITQE